VAAVAFANSTGLPITLLSVIHKSVPPDTELGRVDPLLYLSVYLITYPIIQWGFGSWLLEEGSRSWLLDVRLEESLGSPLLTHICPASDEYVSGTNMVEYDPVAMQGATVPTTLPLPPASVVPTATQSEAVVRTGTVTRLVRNIMGTAFKPPVVAVLAALLVVLLGLQGIFVDVTDRDNDAPLEFFFDGMHQVGQAAVPINMMILGANLHEGANFVALPWRVSLYITICRMLLMPILGVCAAVAMRAFFPLDASLDASFYLVVMIVSATPTANNIMIMVERSGENKEAMATCIFMQYMLAPLFLCASITAFVSLA
jgi:predicted permease